MVAVSSVSRTRTRRVHHPIRSGMPEIVVGLALAERACSTSSKGNWVSACVSLVTDGASSSSARLGGPGPSLLSTGRPLDRLKLRDESSRTASSALAAAARLVHEQKPLENGPDRCLRTSWAGRLEDGLPMCALWPVGYVCAVSKSLSSPHANIARSQHMQGRDTPWGPF